MEKSDIKTLVFKERKGDLSTYANVPDIINLLVKNASVCTDKTRKKAFLDIAMSLTQLFKAK